METVNFPGLAGSEAFIRTLSVADVDSCVRVESTFPEQERCSKDKVGRQIADPPQALCNSAHELTDFLGDSSYIV